MKEFISPKSADIIDIKGAVHASLDKNTLLNIGDTITSGMAIVLAEDSEITLAFDDGTQQHVYGHTQDETAEEQNVDNTSNTSATNSELSTAANANTPNDVLDDINAIQALIESGDDVELPDTAAGGIVANEGSSFISLSRDGAETLAQSGYDTAELANTLTAPNIPDTNIDSEQPTLTQSDQNTVEEEQTVLGNVLDNDSDLDDVLTIQSYTVLGDATVYLNGQTAIVEGGSLLINTDGSYSFIPANNWNGVLPTITYTTNTNATDTLTITVTPLPDLNDDNEVVNTVEDVNVSGNVLENSSSPDNPITVTDFTIDGVDGVDFTLGDTVNLAEGDLTLNADGSYTFVPSADYNGTVPVVTYTVIDGAGDSDTSTLAISVTPVADLLDDNEVVSTLEDTTLTGNVLDNSSSPDNPITVTDFTIDGVDGVDFILGDTVNLAEGDLTLNADGSYTFVPSADYNGVVPVVTYTVIDGAGDSDTSTLAISVTPVADLLDDNEVVSTLEDTTLTGNVLDNSSSPDNPITVTDFTIDGVDGVDFILGDTVNLAEGDLTLNADGSYTFVPSADYNGVVPVVTYTVIDGAGDSDTSTLAISVTPVPDLTDGNESVIILEGNTVTGNVLDNGASPDGPLTVTEFTVSGDDFVFVTGETANLAEGDLTLNADGSYSFVPSTDYNGTVPVVTYTVLDGAGDIDTSTLTITVIPAPNLPPVAADDSFSVNEGETVTGNVITHQDNRDGVVDTDGGDGAALFITQVNGVDLVFAADGYAEIRFGGDTLRINAQGDFEYTQNSDQSPPNFTYTLSDGTDTDTATVTLTVVPWVNLPPVAADDSFSVNEGETVTGNVISHNDGDGVVDTDGGDGAALFITQVNGVDLVFAADGYAEIRFGGDTLRINAQGDFEYTQNSDQSPPNFTYTLSDGTDTDTATVTLTVVPWGNLPPVAEDDSFSVNEGGTVGGNVITHDDGDLKVDTDGGDGDTLSVTHVNGELLIFDAADGNYETIAVEGGTLRINADGQFTYTNSDGFVLGSLPPTFTYTLSDGIDSDATPATVTINVVDSAPVANDDSRSMVLEGDAVNGLNSQSIVGNIIITGGVGDVEDTSDAEDAPLNGTPNLISIAYDENGDGVITSSETFVFDAANTSYVIEAKYGTLTIQNTGAYTYTSVDGQALPFDEVADVFTYIIEDNDLEESETDTATLTINLSSNLVNLPPEAEDDSFSVNEGGTVGGNVITHDDGDLKVDTDGGDGDTLSVTHVNGELLIFDAADGNYETIAVEGGTLRINADGQFTYTNSDGFVLGSLPPTFTYTLSDGIDSDLTPATVTINVLDSAPVANADNNYINLSFEEGDFTAGEYTVDGNVVTEDRSSGDRPDSSESGQITLINVIYMGITHNFDVDGNIVIETDYGVLSIDNTGSYSYVIAANTEIPDQAVTDVFTYTIQDNDESLQETAFTTLTININVPASTPNPFSDPDDSNDIAFNQESTIDTSFQQGGGQGNIGEKIQAFTNEKTLDLSDLLSDERSDSLDQYLTFGEKLEETPLDVELINTPNDALIAQTIDTGAAEHNEVSPMVTNGLLADGGTIVSDTAAPAASAIADMESTELL